MKQQFLENIADTFKTYVYANNRKIVPSAATLTVYRPAESAVFINAATMTVAADGLLSYALTADNNLTRGEDYKAVIKYTFSYDSADYYFNLFYDVVKSKLVKVITDDDLVNELPQLKDNGWKARGTASSGSTTTIVDSALNRAAYPDNYFTGGTAYSVTKDETREITNFVSSTGTVTTAAFSSAISNGEKYVLTRSFGNEIQRAFEKIEEKLKRKGRYSHLVLDPYDLREAHIMASVAEACKGFLKDGQNSFWWELWKDYERKADDAFNGLTLKYDASGDGIITDNEKNRRFNTIKVRF